MIIMCNIKAHFLSLQCLLFRRVASQHGWIPRLNKTAPSDLNVLCRRWWRVGWAWWSSSGRVQVVSSNNGSGGFASTSTGGSVGASVNGEDGLDGSDTSTGGSSTSLATFAFLDLSWPLRKMLQDHQYKDTIWATWKYEDFSLPRGSLEGRKLRLWWVARRARHLLKG